MKIRFGQISHVPQQTTKIDNIKKEKFAKSITDRVLLLDKTFAIFISIFHKIFRELFSFSVKGKLFFHFESKVQISLHLVPTLDALFKM